MNENKQTTTITLLKKTYTVNCPIDKVNELREAADHLNARMYTLQNQNPHRDLAETAILAALHITHDLLSSRRSKQDHRSFNGDLQEEIF